MKVKWFGGAAAAALCMSVAAAQETATAEGDAGEIRLASIDTITVYATRSPLPAFDYPGQVSVVGRDVIDDFNPQTVADIFDAIPGARFDGGPRRNGEAPSVRGVEGEGVLVLFDGARQSFLSGHDGRFFIDPELLKAVEVVRGPTSALYGSGALGGVIAVRTIEAEDFLDEGENVGVKLSGGFQSVNDEWRTSAIGVWRSGDGLVDIVGNVGYRTSGDIELGSGLTLPADDEILSSLLKTTVRPSDELTIHASWIQYSGDSIDPNNPQGGLVSGPGNELVNRDIDGDTFQAGFNYNPDTNLVEFNAVAYYTRNEVIEAELSSPRIVTREVETNGLTLDNRTRFEFGGESSLTFTYGGEFYEDKQRGRDNTTPDGRRGGVPDAKERFYGAFVQGELALDLGGAGMFTIIPGVRWDKFETEAPGEPDTDDSAVSPKIGASWKPIPEIIVFGNWAEAFRAPSFNEIYADDLHFQIPDFSAPPGPPIFVSNFFVTNAGLVPEESETWEAGAGVDFGDVLLDGDRLIAKASYYASDVTNLIDLEVNIPAGCFGAPFPPCGSGAAFGNFSRYVNVTNAAINGVELESQYDSEYFYIRANYSTIDGEDVATGDYVGVLSPSRFFIDGGVKIAGGDVRLGSRVTIASDFTKVNTPADARDGYAVGDIYFVWQPSSGALEGIRVDLGVDNVTDADYEVVAAGVSQPGRNFKVALSWRQGF